MNRILLKLTSLTSIAHGDASPNAVGANNTRLFNRQLQRIEKPVVGATEEEAQSSIALIFKSFPVGDGALPFLESLSGSELIATLFVANVPLMYGGEGEGLFQGMERYRYLSTRLGDGVQTSSTLPELWHYISLKLGLSMFPEAHFEKMSAFFMLPYSIQGQAIGAIARKLELTVMGSRLVADSIKQTSVKYTEASNLELFAKTGYEPTPKQIAELTQPKQEAVIVPIPALSGNSLRHCILREPGANRLLGELGLAPYSDQNIENIIPIGVTRFLYAGGQMAAKSKAPNSSDLLEAEVRERYPLIDALGGSTDSFIFGEAACKIASWVICKENNFATEAIANITSNISIYDYIEETTRTRSGLGGKDKESGQMIFSYETLAAGLPVLVEVTFNPFTRPLTKGSIISAIHDWDGILGGRSDVGHGKFSFDWLDNCFDSDGNDYMEYLRANKEELANGLLDGSFGTKTKLCTA